MPEATAHHDEDAAVIAAGDVVAGKFLVERVIGEGGMGVVVVATHQELGERVALKFLRRSAMRNPEIVARFAQEARAAARLKSQYIARVLDVGKTEAEVPFMVMEYLEGQDLARTLQSNGAFPIEEAVDLVIQTCEGLAEAHSRGIVHRDVKPENLFLVESHGWRVIKILDFGISKAALTGNEPNAALIQTSNIMGSPCYMSPEQLRSTRNVDHRADIWSLGAVLFELLTASSAFDNTVSLAELIGAITMDPPRDMRAMRPEIPAALAAVCYRCLEKDASARYQNAAELAIALLKFAPRRARTTTERAISITKGSGHFPTADLRIPDESMRPPSSRELATDAEFVLGNTSRPPSMVGSQFSLVTGTGTGTSTGTSTGVDSGAGSTSSALSTISTVSPPPSTSRRVVLALGGLAALAALGLGAALVVHSTVASGGGPDPQASAGPAETIDVALTAEPRETRFQIDNGPLLENPYVGKLPKDGASHVIHARAAGYKEKTRDVTFSSNVKLGLLLAKDPTAPK